MEDVLNSLVLLIWVEIVRATGIKDDDEITDDYIKDIKEKFKELFDKITLEILNNELFF